MAVTGAREIASNIKMYFKGAEDAVSRRRSFFAVARQKGNLVMNAHGLNLNWGVKYKRIKLVSDPTGESPMSFSKVNRIVRPELDWTGYYMTDRLSRRERLITKGDTVLVNQIVEIAKNLREDAEESMAEEMYNDVKTTGDADKLVGIGSLFSSGTDTIQLSDGESRSYNAADIVFAPAGSYANTNMALGAVDGSWETSGDKDSAWPYGRGDEAYDFFSAVDVNYETTGLGNSAGWVNNDNDALRYMQNGVRRRVGEGGNPMSMGTMDYGLWNTWVKNLETKERIVIDSNLELRALGFKDAVQFDGVEYTPEYGLPGPYVYGWNPEAFEMHCLTGQMFEVDEEKILTSRSTFFALMFDGQAKWHSPRNFGRCRPQTLST